MGFRILLVDDDQILTDKIRDSLDWESLQIDHILTANNIFEAKGMLKASRIDLLLCDIDMPMGSGLELLEWIRETGLDIRCIFLSSYASFQYAQKAMQLGSVNYLLKPISNTALEKELRAVIDELMKDRSGSDLREGKRKEELWKQYMLEPVLQEDPEGLGEIYTKRDVLTLILTFIVEQSSDRFSTTEIASFNLTFHDTIQEIFGENRPDAVVTYNDTSWLTVIRGAPGRMRLQELLNLASGRLTGQTGQQFCFYVAKARPFSEIAEAVHTLRQMKQYAVPNQSLLTHEEDWKFTKIPYPEPEWEAWKEEILKASAYEAVRDKMIRYLHDACGSGCWYKQNLRSFQKNMNDMFANVLRAKELSFEELLDSSDYEQMIFRARQSEDGCRDMIAIVLDKADRLIRSGGEEDVVQRLKTYIDENLDGDLSRSALASHVFLSEDYVTRIFIRETGITLPNFISGRRMKKASRLLAETDLPISRIALDVGYSNFSYFSKTFRDTIGCTPNEYRSRHRAGGK